MRARDPFGQALFMLRRMLRDDGLAPGQHLPINDISVALGLSASPVREALSRLCGEGLVEERRGLGYFTRAMPTEDIVGLLELEQAHVELAVRLSPVVALNDGGAEDLIVWIRKVVEASGSVPLQESFERVSSRLDRPRALLVGTSEVDEAIEGDPVLRVREAYRAWIGGARLAADRLRRTPPTVLQIDDQ